jgi:hypothetical protein
VRHLAGAPGAEDLHALKLLNKQKVVVGEQHNAVVREVEILKALQNSKLALHYVASMQVSK